MDTTALTKMPPQRLAIVVGGGVGVGLLWRWYAKRKGTKAGSVGGTYTDASGVPVDTSQFALAGNSAGNLGAGSGMVSDTNSATRDMGTGNFPLPVSKGVATGANGIEYYIDSYGHILGPVNPTQAPLPTPTGPGTAATGPTGSAGYTPGTTGYTPPGYHVYSATEPSTLVPGTVSGSPEEYAGWLAQHAGG